MCGSRTRGSVEGSRCTGTHIGFARRDCSAYLDGMAEASYGPEPCPICGKPAAKRYRPFCSGRCKADNDIRDVVLSTEEEGVALAAGAWLGGQRAALLMQSSGVGNCINMLSLINTCRFPFLTFITMRGEWAEFNPWQVPMSQATEPVLTAMGVKVYRADHADEVADTAQAAAELAFGGDFAVAVLLSQKLIGRKVWVK